MHAHAQILYHSLKQGSATYGSGAGSDPQPKVILPAQNLAVFCTLDGEWHEVPVPLSSLIPSRHLHILHVAPKWSLSGSRMGGTDKVLLLKKWTAMAMWAGTSSVMHALFAGCRLWVRWRGKARPMPAAKVFPLQAPHAMELGKVQGWHNDVIAEHLTPFPQKVANLCSKAGQSRFGHQETAWALHDPQLCWLGSNWQWYDDITINYFHILSLPKLFSLVE